eukprot:g6472.t1
MCSDVHRVQCLLVDVIDQAARWSVDDVSFRAGAESGGHLIAGVAEPATVVIKGRVHQDVTVTAGTAKFQVYEGFVRSFVASGSSDFFECTNKGCDLTKPKALQLSTDSSSSSSSAYTLTLQVPLPARSEGGDGNFTVVVWAQDQTHKYAMSLSIGYKAFKAAPLPIPTVEIAPGVKLPMAGLGTWLYNDSQAEDAAIKALALGYTHID